MTDSMDTQALSSKPSSVSVAEPLAGMLVAGYTVLVFPQDNNQRSIMYGTFATLESAREWADLLDGIVVIYPIYEPTFNRG